MSAPSLDECIASACDTLQARVEAGRVPTDAAIIGLYRLIRQRRAREIKAHDERLALIDRQINRRIAKFRASRSLHSGEFKALQHDPTRALSLPKAIRLLTYRAGDPT